MAKKTPFQTEQEEEEYHLELLRDMVRKLTALAQDRPELADQLLGNLMLSAELLVSNAPTLKDEVRNLTQELDQTVQGKAKLPRTARAKPGTEK